MQFNFHLFIIFNPIAELGTSKLIDAIIIGLSFIIVFLFFAGLLFRRYIIRLKKTKKNQEVEIFRDKYFKLFSAIFFSAILLFITLLMVKFVI